MIATQSGNIYKKYQERFIKKNRSYLREKGKFIKPVKLRDDKMKVEKAALSRDDQSTSSQKLEELADKVSQPLLTMTTIPYLQIFPTTITIDLKKITINDMTFVKSHSVQTLTYDNIREISLETGILASGLRFVLGGQFLHPIIVPNFPKKDAVLAKKLILGLMQCHKQQIKADELDPVADREKIITLGTAATP